MNTQTILFALGFFLLTMPRKTVAPSTGSGGTSSNATNSLLGSILKSLQKQASSSKLPITASNGSGGGGGGGGSQQSPTDYSGYDWQQWVSDLEGLGNSAGPVPDGSTADTGSSSSGFIDPVDMPTYDPPAIDFQPDPSTDPGSSDNSGLDPVPYDSTGDYSGDYSGDGMDGSTYPWG